jgi:hypothetical protein
MANGGEPGLLYGPNQLGWSPPSSDTGLPADRHPIGHHGQAKHRENPALAGY